MSQPIKRAKDAAVAGVAEADMEVELPSSNNVDGVIAENVTNETGPHHNRETLHADIAAKEGMTKRSARPETRSVSNVKGQDILATEHLEQTPELAV